MSCINPITNVPYQIGDDGPGGGIIFSIPGQGLNNTNHYFEVARYDVSVTQRNSAVLGQSCTGQQNAIPGAEFGVYKEVILSSDNGTKIGDGINNTIHLNSYPTSISGTTPNPTNPVLDIHDLAAKLCIDYVDTSGYADWFLPSLDEASELMLNLGPPSQAGNVANLNTSNNNPASAFYWTSSVILTGGYNDIAIGFNATAGGGPQIMDRCSTGSVRPVRMFECVGNLSVGIDYNYRYNGSSAQAGVGGVGWWGADRMSSPWYQGGNPAYNIIGTPFLVLYLTIFDAKLNKSHPNVSYGSLNPQNPITLAENWWGWNPMYPWGPTTQNPMNPYKITIYDLNEQLVGSWTYSDVYGIGSCSPTNDCYFQVTLGNPTPDPGTPTLYDCGSIPQPSPLGPIAFTTPCLSSTWSGEYPYYILIENTATQEIMTSPLGNGVGNTTNLTNYAGTGTNMRFIDNSGNAITPTQDFQYHQVCCSIPNAACYFRRWLAELSPTHPSFSNVTCTLGNISPLMDKQLYIDCAAASLACTPGVGIPKLANPTICITQNTIIKGNYTNNENQIVEITHEDDTLFIEEEYDAQKLFTLNCSIRQNSTKNIFNITFKTKDGYYYSKSPSLNMNFPGSENYRIKVESESKNANGYVIEKTFNISYKNTGFDVFEEDGHNIIFTNKIAKEVVESEIKEITALHVDKSSIDSTGESRNISVVGTPGSTFSLTIKDKNNRNVLPYSSKITKTIKNSTPVLNKSATLELNNAAGLEVGMVVLNDQRRGVKITGISDPVKTNVDAINETSTTFVTISSHLTLAVDDSVTFAKETDITEVAIPNSGTYSFTQRFPVLEKFKRTLKTVASGVTSLTLDYTKDLEKDMKITGTGVDGNDPTISADVTSDTVITVSDSQTIADETELTFEMPDNRYDITLYPLMAILGDNVPRYSSKDNDTLPTYSIYQYVDPIVIISPYSVLSNVTTAGTITLTGKANKGAAGTNGDITISMTATKSDGSLEASREPRFSSIDSEASDFSNTLNTISKTVREGERTDRNIVHLNNTTGIRVGMIVTGGSVSEPYSENSVGSNLRVTVKSIVGTTVELSSKQTTQKGDVLVFSSMFNMHISGLTTTFSANGGFPTGVCTVAGTGKITTFGIDSFTSTLSLDNFLSAV